MVGEKKGRLESVWVDKNVLWDRLRASGEVKSQRLGISARGEQVSKRVTKSWVRGYSKRRLVRMEGFALPPLVPEGIKKLAAGDEMEANVAGEMMKIFDLFKMDVEKINAARPKRWP